MNLKVIKGHKTTFMPKSFYHFCLRTDFDEKLYKNTICSIYYVCPKMHFYVIEKFFFYFLPKYNLDLWTTFVLVFLSSKLTYKLNH